MVFAGSCHCGNLELRFETERPPESFEVRACQCSFCRRHAARTATDPAGQITLEVGDAALLSRYRFGLGTCDFLICARCGAYVAALLEEDGRAWATINVNALDDRDRFGPGTPVSYDGEDATARIARRKARWTPARWAVRGPPGPDGFGES